MIRVHDSVHGCVHGLHAHFVCMVRFVSTVQFMCMVWFVSIFCVHGSVHVHGSL